MTRPMLEKDFGKYEILLTDTDGNTQPAIVELGCRDWTENRLRHLECRITLKWENNDLEAIETDFFRAFCRIREALEQDGLYPVCYGASRRIIVTGMATDMGLGLRIYKILPLGSEEHMKLVWIFDTGPDVEPVSVETQNEFKRQYRETNGKI